jgi:phosphoserine aminotransferase
MSRKHNFYAGPATMPLEVLEQLRDELVDYQGMGMSIIETSHRSKEYDVLHNETIALVKKLLKVPDNYKILFLGGGATLQFSMIPMNLLAGGKTADIAVTGAWAKKAQEDMKKYGKANVVFDGKANNFMTLPKLDELKLSPDAEYLHVCSNETIGGIQFKKFPKLAVPYVCDMSSDILSRPVPVENFGIIFAGAQKNLGPAGLTLVIIRDDLLEKTPESIGAYLGFKTHVTLVKGKDGKPDNTEISLYNTPPVFSVWALNKCLKWIEKMGGAEGMQKHNEAKAKIIYDAINASKGFYNCPVEEANRSTMNIVWTIKKPGLDEAATAELDKAFLKGSEALGMLGLAGHRSVGGFRASVYNACTKESCQALADYMTDFAKKNA